MSNDLNNFNYEDGIDDVLAVYVNRLLASSMRSEYKNIEVLAANRTLLDADTPLQRLDGDGSNWDVFLPLADLEENHPFLLVNASAGAEVLTVKSNDGTVTICVLGASDKAFLIPDGDGTYMLVSTTSPVSTTALYPNIIINGGLNYAQWLTAPDTLTNISDNAYCADRFRVTRENADVQYQRNDGSGESGITSRYFGTLKKITNGGKIHVCQPIEAISSVPLRGKTITFQVKLKASSSKSIRMAVIELQNAGAFDTIPATLVTAFGADTVDPTLGANLAVIGSAVTKSVTTSWQLFSVTVTVPTNSKNLLPAFWTHSDFAVNDTLSFAEVDLHVGSNTQAWTEPDATLEFERISQFSERISASAIGNLFGIGTVETTSLAICFFTFHHKRTNSLTMALSAVSDFRVRYGGLTSVVTAMTISNALNDRAQLNATPTGTPLTVGQAVMLQAATTSASILVSTEL
jgi:hypothetical protein